MAKQFKAAAGQVIFRPGQECPGFLSLTKGSIRVTLTGFSGREVVLYRVRPGEICLQTFSCLTDGKLYGAEGVAESDLEGEMIMADAFHKRLEDDNGFLNDVLGSVALRFMEYQQLVEDVALTGFDARLAKTLLKLADAKGFVRTTHAALAAETASGRAYVTRRLAVFAAQGHVEQHPEGVLIVQKNALEQIIQHAR